MSSASYSLGHSRMRLVAPDEIIEAFEHVVAADRSASEAETFTVAVEARGSSGDRWAFTLPDASVEFGPMTPSAVAQSLLTQYTRLTVLSHPDSWFLHAGAVVGPDGAVAMMAPSGTGKSTFTGRLLQAGYRYLSDELAWIRPGTWEVCAYPKPLALDDTSLSLLGLSDPAEGSTEPGAGGAERLLPADVFSAPHGSGGGGAGFPRLRLLACLTRGSGSATDAVHRMDDADKVAAVLTNQLNLMDRPDALQSVCDLVGEIPTARIAVDDLDAAVSSVRRSFDHAEVASLRSLVTVPCPALEQGGVEADQVRARRSVDPFGVPGPVEPLSIATFADGSGIVVGRRSGRYVVTNAGGAALAGALGEHRAIIDLAPECGVEVRDAEAFFADLGDLHLVALGGPT